MKGVLRTLRSSPIFKDLNEDTLCRDVAPFLLNIHYKNHDTIISEGEISKGIYLLVDGRVKLSSFSDNRELIIGYITPGQAFGYESCLSGHTSSVECTADKRSQCLWLSTEHLKDLLCENRAFALSILKDAYQRLENTRIIMTGLIFQPARQKVARALCYLDKVNENPSGIVKATRADVARLAAVRRETATRIVKEFENDGLLDTDGKFAIIRNSSKLREIRDRYS